MTSTNSRRKPNNARSDSGLAKARFCDFANAIGDAGNGLQGRLRAGLDGRTDTGCADESAARNRLRQPLRGESLGRRKETSAAGPGHQGTAAGRHACGVAAGSAGAQRGRISPAPETNPGRRRDLSQPDGELRLQHGNGRVRPDHPGGRGAAGKADHRQANGSGYGRGARARAANRRPDQIHGVEEAKGPRLAPGQTARGGSRAAARSVSRDDHHLPQSRNAGAAADIVKVYCHAIPFCTATQQHQAAAGAGIPERAIYVEGRGAETFDVCVAQFRGTGGRLGLIGGLRVLGASRVLIVSRVRLLKSKGIIPYDFDTGVTDEIELLNDAIQKINGQRALGEDPRRPRRMGARGGIAKGRAAAERRNAIMNQDIVRRICIAPELNWHRRAEILGGAPFSESTLRRLYGE